MQLDPDAVAATTLAGESLAGGQGARLLLDDSAATAVVKSGAETQDDLYDLFGSPRREPRKNRERYSRVAASETLEHETGLEPATTTLATWSSTN